MKKPPMHTQVKAIVKAYVDEGVKDLVELLNSYDKLSTCDSCQGGNGKDATIYCEYGTVENTSCQEVCEFVCKLIALLATHIDSIDSPCYKTHISIEWWGTKTHPLILIQVPPDCIGELTNVLSCVRRDLENDNVGK